VSWSAFLAFPALVLLVKLVSYVRYERNRRTRRAAWKQVAAERHGELREVGNFWLRRSEILEVDAGPVRVHVDHCFQGHQTGSLEDERLHTRCRASYPVPAGPKFRSRRKDLVETLGTLLGDKDVVLDVVPAFDEHFVMRGDDAGAVRAVWSEQAMQSMLRWFKDASIESDGVEVTLRIPKEIHDVRRLGAAIDLVGALAGADIFGDGALRALPGATYHPPAGPWDARTPPCAVIEDHVVPVTITLAVIDRQAVTWATARDGARDQSLRLLVHEDGSTAPAEGAAMLPLAAAPYLRRVGSGTLVMEDAHTSFIWHAVETDPARLAAGARLVAILAGAAPQGIFR
jgi:hypothetical protein